MKCVAFWVGLAKPNVALYTFSMEGKYLTGLTDTEFAEELCCKSTRTRIELTKACRGLLTEPERVGKAHEQQKTESES